MTGYQEVGLVVVLSDVGQTFGNELSFHLLAANDNLHPGLQVKNTAICLCPIHTNTKMSWFLLTTENS